ncbi:MAG TPA: hypothetical protein VFV67_03360 [Actinophytocola sp.]|uniref:hypothetical protein n=1 Tax=Actinophytocola sp. TaxID=1872138 RepID=UPI002DBFDE1D|nr:hypothetical protein [Actinophytocola sp.]HEU5469665.1 hypothetical protein [Actinophytocola sp.]
MANYTVSVLMSKETVNNLSQNNFVLYGFKAVRTTLPGAPLVWFQTTAYGETTELNWTQRFRAYTSRSKIVPGGLIRATNSYDIDLGQTLEVTDKSGTGSVVLAGNPGAVSILNQTSTEFTCGVSEMQPDGGVTPMCAFPLFGNNLDVIAPVERILLTFSTTPVNTGTVIYQAYSPGVLIDLTGTDSRTVGYDINAGWSWGGGAWGRQIAPSQNLVPLLIETSTDLSQQPRTGLPPATEVATGSQVATGSLVAANGRAG